MKNYQLITVYSDLSCKTETTNDLPAILRAIAIYYEEPDFVSATVYDIDNKLDIVHIIKD